MTNRSFETISVEDIRENPVWRFANDRTDVETALEPVRNLPCDDLIGKIVGVQVELADGTKVWGIVGNFDPTNSRSTQHFVTLSIESHRGWFHLARYHDVDYERRGPAALAEFFGRGVDSVFPIAFDLAGIVKGDRELLKGVIRKEPEERLTRSELIAMAVL